MPLNLMFVGTLASSDVAIVLGSISTEEKEEQPLVGVPSSTVLNLTCNRSRINFRGFPWKKTSTEVMNTPVGSSTTNDWQRVSIFTS